MATQISNSAANTNFGLLYSITDQIAGKQVPTSGISSSITVANATAKTYTGVTSNLHITDNVVVFEGSFPGIIFQNVNLVLKPLYASQSKTGSVHSCSAVGQLSYVLQINSTVWESTLDVNDAWGQATSSAWWTNYNVNLNKMPNIVNEGSGTRTFYITSADINYIKFSVAADLEISNFINQASIGINLGYIDMSCSNAFLLS